MGNNCCAHPRNDKLPKVEKSVNESDDASGMSQGHIDIVDVGAKSDVGQANDTGQEHLAKDRRDKKSFEHCETQKIESAHLEMLP